MSNAPNDNAPSENARRLAERLVELTSRLRAAKQNRMAVQIDGRIENPKWHSEPEIIAEVLAVLEGGRGRLIAERKEELASEVAKICWGLRALLTEEDEAK